MNKRIRQCVGLFFAILAYYVIHEGSHLLSAIYFGVFKKIRFMNLGIQIDVYSEKMTSTEMGLFCLLGSVSTVIVGYLLVITSDIIIRNSSKYVKAGMYYITIAMLLIDPLYLSLLYDFFGGGDMNGISLLVPEILARIVYGGILVFNIVIYFKIVLPKYKIAFDV